MKYRRLFISITVILFAAMFCLLILLSGELRARTQAMQIQSGWTDIGANVRSSPIMWDDFIGNYGRNLRTIERKPWGAIALDSRAPHSLLLRVFTVIRIRTNPQNEVVDVSVSQHTGGAM
jgi:hypothetical protein